MPPRPSSRLTNGTQPLSGGISPTANLPSQNTAGGVKSRTKAEILREYRVKAGRPQLPEDLLLRDVLYLLQGISGKYVRFDQNQAKEGCVVFVEDGVRLVITKAYEYLMFGRRVHTAIHHSFSYAFSSPSTIGAWLLIYKSIGIRPSQNRKSSRWVDRTGSLNNALPSYRPLTSLLQSLCHHLQQQLTEYFRLLAVLEAQAQAPTQDPDLSAEDSGLTLRRLLVWTEEWRLRLRMMSVCVENCSGEPVDCGILSLS